MFSPNNHMLTIKDTCSAIIGKCVKKKKALLGVMGLACK